MITIDRSDVCAVITTYRPDHSIRGRIDRARSQVGDLIVVDDSGESAPDLNPEVLGSNVIYIKNVTNAGIAAALNSGVSKAKEMGYKWILTLDDDTIICKEYVAKLLACIGQRGHTKNAFGIASLSRRDDSNRLAEETGEHQLKRTIITSGSLMSVDAFTAVNGFSEELFIDLVDFDYCTRLRRLGYEIVQFAAVGMQHKVGDSTIKRVLGIPIVVYNHAPFRLYYQIRNCLIFFKRNLLIDPVLSCYLVLDVFRVPLKVALFEKEKTTRFRYCFLGLVDGLSGKAGRYADRKNNAVIA